MRVIGYLRKKLRERPIRFRTFFVLLPVLLILSIGTVKIGGLAAVQIVPRDELSTRTVSSMTVYREEGIEAVLYGQSVYAPVREEFKYRVIPFYGLFLFWLVLFGRGPGMAPLIVAGLGTSAYFGYMHGGYGNILIQGFIGLFLWWTFVVMSNNGRRPFTGYLCAIILHSLYNLGQFGIRLVTSMVT